MTPYEYMDLSLGSGAAAMTMVTFGFTIMSGYLLVAYTIGAKLARRQVYAITFIYTISMINNIASHLSNVVGAIEYGKLAGEISAEAAQVWTIGTVSTVLVVRVSIFIVSLWFMWDVRRNKA
jgi:hypothetical protein